MGERTDGLVVELIGAAILAGAYSGLVRQHPESQGLEKLRAKWSGRVTALAGEVAGRAVGAARPLNP